MLTFRNMREMTKDEIKVFLQEGWKIGCAVHTKVERQELLEALSRSKETGFPQFVLVYEKDVLMGFLFIYGEEGHTWIIHNADEKTLRKSQKVLETAVKTGAAANTLVKDVLRYDLNISNAITSVANERGITDIVVGIKKGIVSDSLGRILENVLIESSVNAFVYSSVQPISTIKRHVVVIPELIEREAGFIQVVNRLWNVISNTGTRMRFFGSTEAIAILQNFFKDKNCEVTYVEFDKWDDWRFLLREVRPDDMIWTLLSRKGGFSYVSVMSRVPRFLSRYLSAHSFVLAYPKQATVNEGTMYLT